MPTFDLYAFGRGLLRFTIYAGVIAWLVGVLSIIITFVDFFSVKAVESVNQLQTSMTLAVPTCLAHMLDVLHIDVFVVQILTGIVGLGMVWAGIKVQLLSFQFGMMIKNLLVKSI